MRTLRLAAIVVALTAVAGAAVCGGKTSAEASCLEPLAVYDLSDPSRTTFDLRTVRDLRWLDDESFALAAFQGAYRYVPAKPSGISKADLLVERGNSRHQLPFTTYIGYSQKDLAVGSVGWVVGWKKDVAVGAAPGIDGAIAFDSTRDLDLYDGKLAVLGMIRDDSGTVAPEGVILRTGQLGAPIDQFRKLQYSIHRDKLKAGKDPAVGCGLMMMTAIRFLADGSLLVVPGFEPDVFHYSPSGRLLKTWSHDQVGFDAGCPIPDDEEKISYYWMNEQARFEWINQRRVVDEILPLPGGEAGLLVRTVKAGQASWAFKILDPDHSSDGLRECPLPIDPQPSLVRLSGDVRGDTVALLVSHQTHQPQKPDPQAKPRILTFRYRSPAGRVQNQN